MKISPQFASLLAWSVCGLSIVLAAIGWALFVLSGHVPDQAHGDHGMDPIITIAFVGVGAVGALIASRQTRNAVGWLLWALGVSALFTTNGIGYGYVQYALEGSARPLPAAEWVAWLSNCINTTGFVGFGMLFMLFPNGQVVSPGWHRVLRASIVCGALVALEEAVRPGPISYFPVVENPVGLEIIPAWVAAVANSAAYLLVLAVLLVGAVSILARFGRSRGIERQQIKWVAYAVALQAGYFCFMAIVSALWQSAQDSLLSRAVGIGWGLAVLSVPLALGVAVLRYHLYAIDRIINRTLVYAALSVLLALAYWCSVVILQQVLRPLTAGSDVAIVGSTLAVAALFQPLRRRIQAAVDRRFYRQRYDAARTLESFSSRLRDEIELDALGSDLLAVVRQTMQPREVTLWLRPLERKS